VFDLVRDVNRRLAARSLSGADAGRALDALRDLDRVLGLLPDAAEPALEADLQALLDERAAARSARGLGPRPIACATPWPRVGSPSRIPATGNAGAGPARRRMPEPADA